MPAQGLCVYVCRVVQREHRKASGFVAVLQMGRLESAYGERHDAHSGTDLATRFVAAPVLERARVAGIDLYPSASRAAHNLTDREPSLRETRSPSLASGTPDPDQVLGRLQERA